MHRVFVYGTLKRGQPNHYLMADPSNGVAKFIGEATTVHAWPLVVYTPYHIPFMLDMQGKGKRIKGEVFEVDEAMLAALDELEEHPTLYERRLVDVELCTESLCSTEKCHGYVMTNFRDEMADLQLLDDYLSQAEAGYILPRDRVNATPTKELVKKSESK